MSTYSLDTAEGRAAAREEQNRAIKELEERISIEKKKQNSLDEENRENLNVRYAVERKIKSKKTPGTVLIVLGIVAALVGLIVAFVSNVMIVGIVMSICGLGMLIAGAVIFSGWKQYLPEKNDVDNKLRSYDHESSQIASAVYEYREQIEKHEEQLAIIDDREKYARFYAWADTVATNHVMLYVTGELRPGEYKPLPPKPKKKYGKFHVSDARIYIDEMAYAHVDLNQLCSLGLAQIEDQGTHKLEIYAEYSLGRGLSRVWESEPVPIKPANTSVFVWLHVSSYQNGTHCYCTPYSTLSEFMEVTGITKDELMEKFI